MRQENMDIRASMRSAHITQKDLAKHLYYSGMTIHRWLKNDHLPDDVRAMLNEAIEEIKKARRSK